MTVQLVTMAHNLLTWQKLASAHQQPKVIDAALKKEYKAGQILG